MNKKIVGIILFISICLLTSCDGKKDENNTKIIHNIMVKYLKEIGINSYTVENIKDYSDINVDIKVKEVSKSDIEDYIKDDLEEHEESYVITDRDYVKAGDVVTVNYNTKIGGNIISNKKEHFMVGKDSFNEQIEEYIIGKKLNKEYTVQLKEPIEYDVNESDGTEIFTFTIIEIRNVKKCKLDKQYVNDNYNFNTVSEYYQYVESVLKQKNQDEAELEWESKLNDELLKCFNICLDEEEVAKYSLNVIEEYKEIAIMYGMSLDEYAFSEFGLSEKELVKKCYYEGEDRIKSFIIYGYIANNNQIHIEEYEDLDKSADELINHVIDFLKLKKGVFYEE